MQSTFCCCRSPSSSSPSSSPSAPRLSLAFGLCFKCLGFNFDVLRGFEAPLPLPSARRMRAPSDVGEAAGCWRAGAGGGGGGIAVAGARPTSVSTTLAGSGLGGPSSATSPCNRKDALRCDGSWATESVLLAATSSLPLPSQLLSPRGTSTSGCRNVTANGRHLAARTTSSNETDSPTGEPAIATSCAPGRRPAASAGPKHGHALSLHPLDCRRGRRRACNTAPVPRCGWSPPL